MWQDQQSEKLTVTLKSCLLSERSWFKTEHAAKYVESIILSEAPAKNKNTNNGNFSCVFYFI